MLYNMNGIEKLLAKGHHTIDTDPLGISMLIKVFGGELTGDVLDRFAAFNKQLTTPVERGFVNDVTATAAIQKADVPGKVAKLLSFATSPEDLQLWERSAGIKIVTPDSPNQPGAAEVNLENILRDLGACISIPLIYGDNMLQTNPTLLEDFWKFDNDAFPMLIIGMPSWLPIKSFKEGLAARGRLHQALIGFYRRLNQHLNNQPVDLGLDMSDVGMVALERNAGFNNFDVSTEMRGKIELGVFWGLNANSQPMVFWFILYIYATPSLLKALREEVTSCLSLSTTSTPPKIDSIDYAALVRDCPLLKSTLFETFRMVNEATSLRQVMRPVTVDDGGHQHKLLPGTWISAPHAGLQHDPSIFPEPEKFIPDRFLEVDEDSGRQVPRYGRLKPWGAGTGICKGRTFAEKEILGIGACFISLWDMDPVGGAWKVPGGFPGTGVKRPTKEVRVIIKRRIFA